MQNYKGKESERSRQIRVRKKKKKKTKIVKRRIGEEKMTEM